MGQDLLAAHHHSHLAAETVEDVPHLHPGAPRTDHDQSFGDGREVVDVSRGENALAVDGRPRRNPWHRTRRDQGSIEREGPAVYLGLVGAGESPAPEDDLDVLWGRRIDPA